MGSIFKLMAAELWMQWSKFSTWRSEIWDRRATFALMKSKQVNPNPAPKSDNGN